MTFDEIKSRIIYEDNHLFAFHKPSGILVQPNETEDESLEVVLKEFLKQRDNKPGNVFLGVIHRIDRPVSGLVVFAKTSKALARMNELFKTRAMKKMYCALVKNRPKEISGTIESYLSKDPKTNKTKSYSKAINGAKLSKTDYKVVANSDSFYLLEVNPHTGRHHQIRVHLQSINCPIGGDLKYGSTRSNPDGSIYLHAKSLEFEHPVTKENLVLEYPLPASGAWKYFL
ncbi:MAG: RluA family pseudouridine synthase [Bacteroidia bacterium]|nr:RluA family pseudouridine synthase [Bacteroidia bacterium]